MITQNIHVRMDAYGIPPVIHAVEGDTWRYLDIYTDDAAINTSNTAAVAIHRPDNSYYTISATPDVGGFYHLEMDQALTRPGKVECQLKVSSGDLVISTYTFYVIVEPSTTGLPTEQLGYDIYDLIDAAQQIQNVGLTEEIKQALLDCFEHVAWTDEHGQDYVDALEAALYPPAELASISAVYTQSGTVYTTDSLDDLKSDLVVTATYTDSTTETVTTYTLSGTLTEGTSVITVSYGGKTTTFNVTVTAPATLSSITAVYTQSGTVYDTDSLDSLKDDLVVTAVYSDSTTQTVASTDYTLSGTLTEGTSTITVSYGGKTTTFTVTVTEAPPTALHDWDFTQSLTDSIGGITAVASRYDASHPLARTSEGLIYDYQGQCIDLGAVYDRGITIDIYVSNVSIAAYNGHVRLLMYGTSDGTGTGVLIFHHNVGWSGYINGSWASVYTGLTSRDALDTVNESKITITIADDGTPSLSINDTLIGSLNLKAPEKGSNHLYIGSIASASGGGGFYSAKVKRVVIY